MVAGREGERGDAGGDLRAHLGEIGAGREIDEHVELTRRRVVGDGVGHRHDLHVGDVAEARQRATIDGDREITQGRDVGAARFGAPHDHVDGLQTSDELSDSLAREQRRGASAHDARLDSPGGAALGVDPDLDLRDQHLGLRPRVGDPSTDSRSCASAPATARSDSTSSPRKRTTTAPPPPLSTSRIRSWRYVCTSRYTPG